MAPDGWLSNLKNELAAAIAISAGALLGSGYAVTWARLVNQGLPTRPVLGALSSGFYIGVALESLILLMFVTGGIIVVTGLVYAIFGQSSSANGSQPRWPDFWVWGLFGLAVSVAGVTFAGAPPLFAVLRHASRDYVIATLVVAGMTMVAPAAIGPFSRKLWNPSGWRPILSLMLVVTTLSTVGFKTLDALYRPNPLPQATVALSPDVCSKVAEAARTSGKCIVRGFYIAESDKWIYLVQKHRRCSTKTGKLRVAGQLVQIPRDQALDITAVANSPAPPKTPCAVVHLVPRPRPK